MLSVLGFIDRRREPISRSSKPKAQTMVSKMANYMCFVFLLLSKTIKQYVKDTPIDKHSRVYSPLPITTNESKAMINRLLSR